MDTNNHSSQPGHTSFSRLITVLVVVASVLIIGWYILEQEESLSDPDLSVNEVSDVTGEVESSHVVYLKTIEDSTTEVSPLQGVASLIRYDVYDRVQRSLISYDRFASTIASNLVGDRVVMVTNEELPLEEGVETVFWLYEGDSDPEEITRLSGDGFVSSLLLSSDAREIAYVRTDHRNARYELLEMDIATAEERVVSDDFQSEIVEGFSYQYALEHWASSGNVLYLSPSCDCDAFLTGLAKVSLDTGEVTAFLEDERTATFAFSPDGSMIAYAAYEKSSADLLGEPVAPFELRVFDVATATSRTLIQSESERFEFPVWSADGAFIAYQVAHRISEGESSPGLRVVRVGDGSQVSSITSDRDLVTMRPLVWLGNETLVYSIADYNESTGSSGSVRLMFSDRNGEGAVEIDSAYAIDVVGVN
jgi:hypothetical protein